MKLSLKLQFAKDRKTVLMTALILILVLLSLFGKSVKADPLSMPEEYISYTIAPVSGTLWAKIDGIYPITYSGNETSLLMVYPTPPGTDNISIKLDGAELLWSDFTQMYPEELHHTAIGDWSMISTVLAVSKPFVLEIHYEHPVQVINGSYMFLYDVNIVEYLSADANKSVAHFTIHMETEFTNLNTNTVSGESETLKPINFTISGNDPTEIEIDEVSEFGKPLPGDLLVSFSEPRQDPISVSWVAVAILVIGSAAVALIGYGLSRRRSNHTDMSKQVEWF